ncbi:MAG: hypothetical protein MUE41_13245 [Gemmatimonadaceae bacterium]|nr:hypothetical protein [Gemmatimonadaceae bacterium]
MNGPASTFAPLVAFELRLQAREFLTWLAALVFLLLTFGHAANGVVELVGDRGTIPRHAPWAIAQAMAGVTAFGQVITAMIAATTVLRDAGTRTQGLLLTTPLAWPTYLLGRFAGTLAVLLVVYAMIPVGLALGFTQGAPAAWRAVDVLMPLALLVVPTVCCVAAVFFAAGARSGGFAVILFVGIAFVGLWQTGMALDTRGVALGRWLDPFGNAMIAHLTREWSPAMRATAPLPWGGDLLGHRALWLAAGASVLAWTIRTWRPALPSPTAVHGDARGATTEHADRTVKFAMLPAVPATPPRAAARAPSAWHQAAAEWRFGWRWVVRERGFTALVVLAMLNAVANGWSVADDPSALLRALEFHTRVFAILIATIYAGELVWRDRDVRADGLLGALPARTDVRLAGRTAGVLTGLAGLPVALYGVAVLLPLLRGASPAPACGARWLLGVSAPLFAALLLGALAVHLIVRSKTVAHLLVIAAWVGAIALGARGLAASWVGYGRC